MKAETCISMIQKMLGFPVVEIEISPEDIKSYIDIAFLEVKPNLSTSKYMTLPFSPKVDLSDKGVYSVVSIYRGDTVGVGDLYSDESLLFGNSVVSNGQYSYRSGVDSIVVNLLQKQINNTMTGTSDIDFIYKKPTLFVEMSGTPSSTMTLEYIPDFKSIDDVDDPYWENLIYRLSLAYSKIALGRIRSKFKVSSVPYELDGDTLLSEGTQELADIRTKLEDSTDLFYPLD